MARITFNPNDSLGQLENKHFNSFPGPDRVSASGLPRRIGSGVRGLWLRRLAKGWPVDSYHRPGFGKWPARILTASGNKGLNKGTDGKVRQEVRLPSGLQQSVRAFFKQDDGNGGIKISHRDWGYSAVVGCILTIGQTVMLCEEDMVQKAQSLRSLPSLRFKSRPVSSNLWGPQADSPIRP